jgi:hypothetical protein
MIALVGGVAQATHRSPDLDDPENWFSASLLLSPIFVYVHPTPIAARRRKRRR